MPTDFFHKTFLTLKDLIGMGFLITMLNLYLFSAFILSPAFLVMMPLFGLTVVGLAVSQARQYSSNSNMEGVLKLINGIINAILMGTIAASMLLFTFLALVVAQPPVVFGLVGFILVYSPILIITSFSLALLTQGVLLGLTLLRLHEAPENSPQRSHFLQASLGYFFDTLTTAFILSSVLALLFAPFTPFILPVLAASALVLTTATLTWRFAPISFKDGIKSALGIESPKAEKGVCTLVKETNNAPASELRIANQSSRLFTAPDHLSIIKGLNSLELEKKYLLKIIEHKLTTFGGSSVSEKNDSKVKLLSQIKAHLNSNNPIAPLNKKHLVSDFPGVFNSFLCEKGEVESIADAYNWYCSREQHTPMLTC